jgi:hypothetical protein
MEPGFSYSRRDPKSKFLSFKLIEEHRFGADDIDEIRVGISETSVTHGGAIYEPHARGVPLGSRLES